MEILQGNSEFRFRELPRRPIHWDAVPTAVPPILCVRPHILARGIIPEPSAQSE